MPPKAVTPGSSEDQRLLAAVSELQKKVQDQQDSIDELRDSRGDNDTTNTTNPLQGLKTPPIPVFTGKSEECNSVSVKSFISSVKRIGEPNNAVDDGKLVQLAKCPFKKERLSGSLVSRSQAILQRLW